VKVVTIPDVREKDYTLAINNYIEKKEQEIIPPAEVRRQYFEALDEMLEAEETMRNLLLEGGYVNE
jgi:type I restriction enzyme M protein